MKVECAFTKMVKVEELKPHPKNPNTHPDRQVELLSKIIENTGWRSPIGARRVSRKPMNPV